MFDQLEQYGITPQNLLDPSGEAFVTLRKVYTEIVDELNKSKETVESEGDSILKSAIAEASKVEGISEKVENVVSQIRALLNEAFEDENMISFLLVDSIQTVKSEVLSERDYQLSKIKRAQPSKVEVSAEFEQKKETAANLAEMIRTAWTLGKSLVKISKPKEVDGKIVGNLTGGGFPLKKSDAEDSKGEWIPDLPKLPRTPGDSAGVVGRDAKVRRLRFAWNGEELPDHLLVTDVCHDYVSSYKDGVVVTWREIKDKLEESKQEMFSETHWKLEFPTGVLEGWLPPKVAS